IKGNPLEGISWKFKNLRFAELTAILANSQASGRYFLC
ncbi:hypothetical protein CFC21_056242, partial [Triticum aestivum]